MPSTSMQSIPRLKLDIKITPYQNAPNSDTPRFLLAVENEFFLVSEKVKAMVLALMQNPDDYHQLELAFEAETSLKIPADQLLKLAIEILPSALLADSPTRAREMPFIISVKLLSERTATRVTGYLSWLFSPPVALLLLSIFCILHTLVLPEAMGKAHGDWTPKQSVELIVLFMLSGLFHELGHTSACRYFKCPHGAIGFGLYFIFPAWYADVTKAWNLSNKQRAIVDLGGVYFQAIFLIFIDSYALTTGDSLAFKLVWLITFTMLFTLNPLFKFDGYWLLSDLSGLHNLHKQVEKSSHNIISRIMGNHSNTAPTLRNTILYIYLVLSILYFTYFGIFLVRELYHLTGTLSEKLNVSWNLFLVSYLKHEWAAIVAFVSLCATVLWPCIVLTATIFFVTKVSRIISKISASFHIIRTSVKSDNQSKV